MTDKYLLTSNPMFRLSLSSLELFHSNFLAYLFDIDKRAFLACFGMEGLPEDLDNYTLEREFCLGKDNGHNVVTDIAILKKGKRKADIERILIIENKIKSYPNHLQLKQQSNLSGNAKRTLLTLFKAEEVCNGTGFCQLLYSDLAKAIREHYPSENIYCKDYADYIDILSAEANKLDIDITRTFKFIDYSSKEDLSEIGMADAYLKYYASALQIYLLNNLPIQTNATNGVTYRNKPVITSWGFSNKKSSVTIFLKLSEELSAGVQIQGDDFRICFDGNAIRKIYKGRQEPSIPEEISYVWKELDAKIGTSKKRSIGCCTYGDDFIYKYRKIDPKEKMASDIVDDVRSALNLIAKTNFEL